MDYKKTAAERKDPEALKNIAVTQLLSSFSISFKYSKVCRARLNCTTLQVISSSGVYRNKPQVFLDYVRADIPPVDRHVDQMHTDD